VWTESLLHLAARVLNLTPADASAFEPLLRVQVCPLAGGRSLELCATAAVGARSSPTRADRNDVCSEFGALASRVYERAVVLCDDRR
jgi:hypothetical protein